MGHPLGWPTACAAATMWAAVAARPNGCRRLFPFSKVFSNLISAANCKFNIKFCRNLGIVKLILLGF
jgi:hypothetical protein